MYSVVYSVLYYYLFNVDNVLLCVIYQLNFTVCMYVCYTNITLNIAFGIIRGFTEPR
jgi:hypothetical protein